MININKNYFQSSIKYPSSIIWFGFMAYQLLLFNAKFIFIPIIVLFQTIQFSRSTQFSSIWPIDRTLSSATTPGLCGLGSDGNKRVIRIPQGSCITGASPSDY